MPRQPRIRIPLNESRERAPIESAREAVERLRDRIRREVEDADEPLQQQPEEPQPAESQRITAADIRRMRRAVVRPTSSSEWRWVSSEVTDQEFRIDPGSFVQANPFDAIPEEMPTERNQEAIDNIVDEIRSCERNVRDAISRGDRYEADYFRGRLDSLQQQIRELEGDDSPYRETGYVVHNNTAFVDFLINSQKAQVGLINNSRRFQLAIQTNRQSYLRKVIALTETRGGLVLRRQPVERGMRHGLRVMRRRDGYFVILERKEDANTTEQQPRLFP